MKPYLLVTGTIFGLAGGLHLWALVREGGPRPPSGSSSKTARFRAIGLGLAFWAFRLTRRQGSAG